MIDLPFGAISFAKLYVFTKIIVKIVKVAKMNAVLVVPIVKIVVIVSVFLSEMFVGVLEDLYTVFFQLSRSIIMMYIRIVTVVMTVFLVMKIVMMKAVIVVAVKVTVAQIIVWSEYVNKS